MIRVRGSVFFTRRLSSSPSINGILISVTRLSGCAFNISGYAYSPSPASPANSNPWLAQSILSRIPRRIIASSSTRNTFTMVFPPGLHFSLSFLSICPNTPVFHFRPPPFCRLKIFTPYFFSLTSYKSLRRFSNDGICFRILSR